MLLNTYEPWKFAFSCENDEITENSFGIIGVPFDSTTSYHSGSRLGPIVVREASFGFEKYNTVFNKDLTTRFHDFGDVNVVPGNCEATCRIVEDTVNEILDLNIRPIVIGGEHSASIGAIKALIKRYGKHEFVKSTYNIQTFKNKDVHKHMDAIEYFLINIDEPIYISIDMDVMDPSIAPNVGNPTPGGLFISEIEAIIETLAHRNVVGLDVVETASNRLGDSTAVVAAKIIYDFLTLIE